MFARNQKLLMAMTDGTVTTWTVAIDDGEVLVITSDDGNETLSYRGPAYATGQSSLKPAPSVRVASTKIVRNRETEEWVVRCYSASGDRLPNADYYTNDKTDAKQTADMIVSTGAWFALLEKQLPNYLLPKADGTTRIADADEFMLMHESDSGHHKWAHFKHRTTRNYLSLRADGLLHIPSKSGNPWQQGTFDE